MCEWFVTSTGGGWHQFKANGSSGNETSRGWDAEALEVDGVDRKGTESLAVQPFNGNLRRHSLGNVY